jgi:hypothetical protein
MINNNMSNKFQNNDKHIHGDVQDPNVTEATTPLDDAACCASDFVLKGASGNPYLQVAGNPFLGIDGVEKMVKWYDENVERVYENVKASLKVPASNDLVSSSCSGESYIGQLLDSYDLREPS